MAVDPGENLMECPLCGKLSRSHSAICNVCNVHCAMCAMCNVQCNVCIAERQRGIREEGGEAQYLLIPLSAAAQEERSKGGMHCKYTPMLYIKNTLQYKYTALQCTGEQTHCIVNKFEHCSVFSGL